jgi:hypothetical protein
MLRVWQLYLPWIQENMNTLFYTYCIDVSECGICFIIYNLISFLHLQCCADLKIDYKPEVKWLIFSLSLFTTQDDELQVKVNKLSSIKTQLPYDYYFLDYCKPKAIKNSAENLGEVLRGDRIENSVYNVRTLNSSVLY